MKIFNVIYVFFCGRSTKRNYSAAHSFLTVIQAGIIGPFFIKLSCLITSICYYANDYRYYYNGFMIIVVVIIALFNNNYYYPGRIQEIVEEWKDRSRLKNYTIVFLFFTGLFGYFVLLLAL